ncbi:hypothetical protein BRAS3809_550009 [Bradyrhizobium sp. STM 3809]|nr:hypothetical protein BRAS3809_550009 [Bradyrhizobium sp. STM 3809]
MRPQRQFLRVVGSNNDPDPEMARMSGDRVQLGLEGGPIQVFPTVDLSSYVPGQSTFRELDEAHTVPGCLGHQPTNMSAIPPNIGLDRAGG